MTINRWTIVAGRGARYFANAGMVVVILVVMAWLMFPAFSDTAGWLWKLLALCAVGLAAAAVQELAARPSVRTFSEALAGLSHTQRATVLKSLRGRVIPSDPAVLATAIRVGAIGQAYDHRYAQKQKGWRWALPAFYLVMAAVQLLGAVGEREIRQALLWAGLGLYFGLYYRWVAYRREQLDSAIVELRAAAIDAPAVAAAAAQTTVPVQIPPQRSWASLLLVAVLGLAFAGAVCAWGEPFPRPKHRDVTFTSRPRLFLRSNYSAVDRRFVTTRLGNAQRFCWDRVWRGRKLMHGISTTARRCESRLSPTSPHFVVDLH